MQHHHTHHHRKKYTKTKIFLGILIFVFIVFFAFESFKRSSEPLSGGVTATSTPAKPKPKYTGEPRIVIIPNFVKQGDPAIITIEGLASTTIVQSFTFNNRPLISFIYEGFVTAFLGVDLYSPTGNFPLVATLTNGKQIKGEIVINPREDVRKPFDIPEKLGGNTPESIKTLISTLATEGKIINAVYTSNKQQWKEGFRFPMDVPMVVDDPYGYTRVINNFTMPHKGTDFAVPIGTPVYAMNKGTVGLATMLRNYGNTVIIDHGLGVQTVYMHLSELKVTTGQTVEKGELLGLSGDTGYAGNPHLHLTVRIWDVSIDPVEFLEILGS